MKLLFQVSPNIFHIFLSANHLTRHQSRYWSVVDQGIPNCLCVCFHSISPDHHKPKIEIKKTKTFIYVFIITSLHGRCKIKKDVFHCFNC